MDSTYDIPEINRRMFRMILPIVIEGALPMLSGMIVIGMIGRIDVLSISSFGIVMIIYSILWVLFRGIAVGVMVLVSRYMAQKNLEKMGQVVQQAMLASFLLALILCISISVGAEIIMQAFNPSTSLLKSSTAYLRIILLGIPFFAVLLMIGGYYQGIGRTITSMSVVLIMHGILAVLSYGLIFGRFGLPILGFQGAAYASVFSHAVALIISMWILTRNKEISNRVFSWRIFRNGWSHIADICRIGLPASCESLLWQLAIMIMTRMLLIYGESAYAAYQIGNTAESISYMPATGFVVAATTLISQAVGAKDEKLVHIYLKQILKGLTYTTLIAAVVFIFFPQTLIQMLTDKTDVIPLACSYLVIMGLVEIPLNITAVLGGGLRALGYPRVPFVISLIGLWLIRVPLVLLSTFVFRFPVISFWIIIALDILVRFLLMLWFYRKKTVLLNKYL